MYSRAPWMASNIKSTNCSWMFWSTQISGVRRTVRVLDTVRFLHCTAKGSRFSGTLVIWKQHKERKEDLVLCPGTWVHIANRMEKTLCPKTILLSYGCLKIHASSFFDLKNHPLVRIPILEVTKLSLLYYLHSGNEFIRPFFKGMTFLRGLQRE